MKIEKRDLEILESLEILSYRLYDIDNLFDNDKYDLINERIKEKYENLIKEDLIKFIINSDYIESLERRLSLINLINMKDNFYIFLENIDYHLFGMIEDYNNLIESEEIFNILDEIYEY